METPEKWKQQRSPQTTRMRLKVSKPLDFTILGEVAAKRSRRDSEQFERWWLGRLQFADQSVRTRMVGLRLASEIGNGKMRKSSIFNFI